LLGGRKSIDWGGGSISDDFLYAIL